MNSKARQWHDLENALNAIQFLSELIQDGYRFDDEKAEERKKSLSQSIAFVREVADSWEQFYFKNEI